MGNSLTCKSEKNGRKVLDCRETCDRPLDDSDNNKLTNIYPKIIQIAEYDATLTNEDSEEPINDFVNNVGENSSERPYGEDGPSSSCYNKTSLIGDNNQADFKNIFLSDEHDLLDDEEGKRSDAKKDWKTKHQLNNSRIEDAESVLNLFKKRDSSTAERFVKSSTCYPNILNEQGSKDQIRNVQTTTDKKAIEKCPLFTLQRNHQLNEDNHMALVINDYKSMLSKSSSIFKLNTPLSARPFTSGHVQTTDFDVFPSKVNKTFPIQNSGSSTNLVYKRSSRNMSQKQNGLFNRRQSSTYNIMREDIYGDDLNKSGLYLNPSHKGPAVSRPNSNQYCKISPLVSSDESMEMKVIAPTSKGLNARSSTCTWRTLQSTGSSNQDYSRGSLPRQPTTDNRQPTTFPNITANDRYSDSSYSSLDGDLTMDKIEEFLEKRDHIDKIELDLLVRNLLDNSSSHAFPDCKSKPSIQQTLNENSLTKVESQLSTTNYQSRSKFMFPAIADREKVLSFSRIPKQSSGVLLRKNFRENNNQNRRYSHLDNDLTTSSSDLSVKSQLSTLIDITPQKLLKDSEKEFFAKRTPFNDKLKLLTANHEDTTDNSIKQLPSIKKLPSIKQLPSIKRLPLTTQNSEMESLHYNDKRVQESFRHIIEKGRHLDSDDTDDDDILCRHLRSRENCTLCTRPPSRGGRELTKYLQKKKNHRGHERSLNN